MSTLWRKTLRDLRRSWALALALVVIIGLAITTYAASIGAYRDLGMSYRETYTRLRFADVTFRVNTAPTHVVAEVADIDGIAAAEGRLIVDTGYELPNGEPIRSRLIGIPVDRRPAVNDILIQEGRFFQPGEEAEAVAIVETHFADIYNIHRGDTVTPLFNGQKLTLKVVGVAVSPEYLLPTPSRHELLPTARTFAVLLVPLPWLQELTSSADSINDVSILLAENTDREATIARVRAVLEPYGLVSITTQEQQPSNQALKLDLEGYQEIAYLMPFLILVVAALSIYILLSRQVQSQMVQIGVMKAIGYSNGQVLLHYLAFGLLIGAAGGLLGGLLGIPLQRMITQAYTQELGIPIVKTRFYPDTFVAGLIASLVVIVLGSVGPSRGAARMAPAQAMHLDPAAMLVRGRRLFVERWIPLSTWIRLALRNVFRIRRRSFGTWLGIVFAFVLVLASWGIIDSMNVLLDRLFHEVERWDLQVAFTTPQTQATLEKVRGMEGVHQVVPMILLPARLHAGDRETDVLLRAIDPTNTLHAPLVRGNRSLAELLAPGHLLTTPPMANKLGITAGESLILETPFGKREYTLSETVNEPLAAVAYISLDEALDLADAPVPVFNALTVTVDANRMDEVKKALYTLPGVYSVRARSDEEADWRSLMGLFYLIMGILMAFAVIMAAAVLFNTMTISVLERERELATMRALGTPTGRIAGMIMLESAILWLLALIPGLLLGTWAAMGIGQTFSTDLFYFEVVIRPLSYLVTAGGILVAALLSTWPSIRHVNRLNLAEATKMIT